MPYLEEDLNSVDEEKDDNDEHEEGVAAVEDVGVELTLFMFYPDLKNFFFNLLFKNNLKPKYQISANNSTPLCYLGKIVIRLLLGYKYRAESGVITRLK